MQHAATNPLPPEVIGSYDLREITTLLIKHVGLHEGLYNLTFEFQIAVGAMGSTPAQSLPGALFGIRGIGLMKADNVGPHSVDAAVVNPVEKPSKQKGIASKTSAK